jgi:Histone-like transcription factor (CBF/NF-Y) and archaeal histone
MLVDSFCLLHVVFPAPESVISPLLSITATAKWKTLAVFPPATIKKIMKTEDFALAQLEKRSGKSSEEKNDSEDSGRNGNKRTKGRFMVAADAPVLLIKACELFIRELTVRAHRHCKASNRSTVQRVDVHSAVGESEMFDFLIDIIPRAMMQLNAASAPLSNPPQPSMVHPPQQQQNQPPAESANMEPNLPQADDPAELLQGTVDLPNFSIENLQFPSGDNTSDSPTQHFSARLQQQQWQSEENPVE